MDTLGEEDLTFDQLSQKIEEILVLYRHVLESALVRSTRKNFDARAKPWSMEKSEDNSIKITRRRGIKGKERLRYILQVHIVERPDIRKPNDPSAKIYEKRLHLINESREVKNRLTVVMNAGPINKGEPSSRLANSSNSTSDRTSLVW